MHHRLSSLVHWNVTSKIAAAVLAFGILFFIIGVALIGAPVTDIGLLSTTIILVLFGVFGLLLGKAQAEAASA